MPLFNKAVFFQKNGVWALHRIDCETSTQVVRPKFKHTPELRKMSKPPKHNKTQECTFAFRWFCRLVNFPQTSKFFPRVQKAQQKLAKGLCFFLPPLGSAEKQNLLLLFSWLFVPAKGAGKNAKCRNKKRKKKCSSAKLDESLCVVRSSRLHFKFKWRLIDWRTATICSLNKKIHNLIGI